MDIGPLLKSKADKNKAHILQKFFKTGKGEYGEGDIFLGITVPEQRKIAKQFLNLSLDELQKMLDSKIHEYRLTALLILIEKFRKSDNKSREDIFNFYLENTININNWDLVDLSAPKIIGNYLLSKDRFILYKLAKSEKLWERRIAIISTYTFIRERDFSDTLNISKILLKDRQDLIHKAVGWMLREIGKKDLAVLEEFLRKRYNVMPRTMLRYAIEKFPEKKRKAYLNNLI